MKTTPPKKTLHLSLNVPTVAMANAVAHADRRSLSMEIIILVEREHTRVFGPQATAKLLKLYAAAS